MFIKWYQPINAIFKSGYNEFSYREKPKRHKKWLILRMTQLPNDTETQRFGSVHAYSSCYLFKDIYLYINQYQVKSWFFLKNSVAHSCIWLKGTTYFDVYNLQPSIVPFASRKSILMLTFYTTGSLYIKEGW